MFTLWLLLRKKSQQQTMQSDANTIELDEVGGGEKGSNEIFETLKLLPSWVKPHMVFPPSSVNKQDLLGHGSYGMVHKGTYAQGQAM